MKVFLRTCQRKDTCRWALCASYDRMFKEESQ